MDRGGMIARGRTAEVFTWRDGQVLKLFLDGWPVEAVEHEAHVTGALHKAGLPVPAVEGTVEVEGRLGIAFERVDGPSMLQVIRSKPCEPEDWDANWLSCTRRYTRARCQSSLR